MNIKEIKYFDSKTEKEYSIVTKYGDIKTAAIEQFLSNIKMSLDELKKGLDEDKKNQWNKVLNDNVLKICTIYTHCRKHIIDININENEYKKKIVELYYNGTKDTDFNVINLKHRISGLPINYRKTIEKIKKSDVCINTKLKNVICELDAKIDKKVKPETNQQKEYINKETEKVDSNNENKANDARRKAKLKELYSNYTMNGTRLDNIEKYGVSFEPKFKEASVKIKK